MTRALVFALVASSARFSTAAGQSSRPLACAYHDGNYLACALNAGHVEDLRDQYVPANEREVRFWTLSGIFFPEQLLQLHQRGDSVTGRVLLVWTDSTLSDSFPESLCTDQTWTTPSGSLCVGRLASPQDWLALLRSADRAGMRDLPVTPVQAALCDQTPIPAMRPGGLPRDRVCQLIADGFINVLEVKSGNLYWRYEFERQPDPTSTHLKRDKSILQLFTCASRTVGDRPC